MRNWIKGHFFTICTTAFEHIMKLYKISPGLTVDSVKIPAKRSQHFRRKYHNIVGHKMLRAFGQQQTACPNISQQGCQTRATCCAQRWCNKLCWCTCIAIVWSGFVITLSGSKDEEVQSTAYHQSSDLPWVFLHTPPPLSRSHCAEYLPVCSDLRVVCLPAQRQQQLHQVYDKFTYLAPLMW